MKKLLRLLSSLRRKEEGMAGPAAAIILSSFMVVGSSLAFVVVNTGTFSAREVSETVMASLDANETFSLEIMPPGGALLIIERTMSPATDRVTGLH